MELVYLWVEDYKNIHHQGFNFSPRFHCEYNEEKKELIINENDDCIPDFFGENILHLRDVKSHFKKGTLPTYSMSAPSFIPGIDFSDYQSYWKMGYPAILISDTAFYRSDNYHTQKDTPDTLNYENMAKVVDGVFEVVR